MILALVLYGVLYYLFDFPGRNLFALLFHRLGEKELQRVHAVWGEHIFAAGDSGNCGDIHSDFFSYIFQNHGFDSCLVPCLEKCALVVHYAFHGPEKCVFALVQRFDKPFCGRHLLPHKIHGDFPFVLVDVLFFTNLLKQVLICFPDTKFRDVVFGQAQFQLVGFLVVIYYKIRRNVGGFPFNVVVGVSGFGIESDQQCDGFFEILLAAVHFRPDFIVVLVGELRESSGYNAGGKFGGRSFRKPFQLQQKAFLKVCGPDAGRLYPMDDLLDNLIYLFRCHADVHVEQQIIGNLLRIALQVSALINVS